MERVGKNDFHLNLSSGIRFQWKQFFSVIERAFFPSMEFISNLGTQCRASYKRAFRTSGTEEKNFDC